MTAKKPNRTPTPLRLYRDLRGWSQKDIGLRLNAWRSYVAAIERDPKRVTHADTKRRIAMAYRLRVADFDALRAQSITAEEAAERATDRRRHATNGGDSGDVSQG